MGQEIISNFESLSEKDMKNYSGKWVVIIGGGIVLSGDSFKEIYKIAKEKFKDKRPLFGKIPELTPTVLSID